MGILIFWAIVVFVPFGIMNAFVYVRNRYLRSLIDKALKARELDYNTARNLIYDEKKLAQYIENNRKF